MYFDWWPRFKNLPGIVYAIKWSEPGEKNNPYLLEEAEVENSDSDLTKY